MILGGCGFFVVSERAPLHRWAVSSLDETTPEDREAFAQIAARLGVPGLTVQQFIDILRSHAYETVVKESVGYYYPHSIHYKVGEEHRILVAYAIRPFSDSTCDNLLDYLVPPTYECDAYRINGAGRLDVKSESAFKGVFNESDFPSLQ